MTADRVFSEPTRHPLEPTSQTDLPADPGPHGLRGPLIALLTLAVLYTLHAARAFLLPFSVALMLKLLLDPLIRRLSHWRVPASLSAALVLLVAVTSFGYGIVQLAHPATDWIVNAPQTMKKLEARLRPLRKPVEQVAAATQQVENIAHGDAPQKNVVETPSEPKLGKALLSGTWTLLASLAGTLLMLYFLLASGDFFLRKLIRVLPTLSNKKQAVEIAAQIEHDVSRYLSTITLVNAALGVAVGFAMFALGMPNPALWGVAAGVLNFLPYLGPTLSLVLLSFVALISFDSLGRALIVPAVYLVLHILESYFLTPRLVAHRLTLNPVAIFLGVSFFAWIWGIAGALLAVPLLAIGKIFCDRIASLSSIGEFLGT
jgi:predicted PurR-regulated permease PerM